MASGLCRGRLARVVEAVHLARQGLGAEAQVGCELNVYTTAWLPIKDGSARHRTVEHFFKAKRLSTELHEVAVSGLASTAFVLDREGLWAKFDHIGATGQTEAVAGQYETSYGTKVVPANLARKISMLVQQPTFRCEPVICPCLLKMNQGPLPWTEGQMLQPAKGQDVIWSIALGQWKDHFFSQLPLPTPRQ